MWAKRWLWVTTVVLIAAALAGAYLLGRSSAPRPQPTQAPVSLSAAPTEAALAGRSAIPTAQATQARVIPQTVVVTATPWPTPHYISRVNAAPGTLVYPLDREPTGLDPQMDDDDASGLVLAQLYEAPFNLRGDGSLAPAAATGYTVSADGKVYTVTLRSELNWSDGRPVIALDYVAGVCRSLSPQIGSRFGYLLIDVAAVTGARDYAAGANPDCGRVGVIAIADHTLRISLEHPSGSFPQILATRAFWPGPHLASAVAPTATDATGSTATGADLSGKEALVTDGPYTVKEWQSGNHLTLVKNPKFWAAGAVALATIQMPLLPAGPGQWAAYEAGDIDVAGLTPDQVTRAWNNADLRRELQILPQPGTVFLGLNTAITPTAGLGLRQAIAAAIDRRVLIEDILHEPWHTPAAGLLPPGLPGGVGTTVTPAPFDGQATPHLLAQAGYSPTNRPAVTFWANDEGQNGALALAIAGMLTRAGIPTRLVLSGWEPFQRALLACQAADTRDRTTGTPAPGCDYNLYLAGWVMDAANPARFLGPAGGQPATAYTHWSSPAFAGLVALAAGEQDAERSQSTYAQAERLLLEQAVTVPLLYYDRPMLVKPALLFDLPLFGPPHFQYWRR